MDLKISRRLSAAAAFVRPGRIAADIGCDHGKLAAELLLSGRCPRVIATDIREKPLQGAKDLIRSLKLEDRTDFYLTDGLIGVPEDAASDIVIAGMGADMILRIAEGAPWLKREGIRLVLVPATKHGLLRRYLAANGFAVTGETAVYEAGHPYAVICADYTGKAREIGFREEMLGSIRPDSPDGLAYWERVLAACDKVTAGQEAAAVPDRSKSERYESLASYIKEEISQHG